jgi:hypothetical protein
MRISITVRRDLVVTDPEGLLGTARRAYQDMYPQATDAEAVAATATTVDAVFALLERFAYLAGADADAVPDGLAAAGRLVQIGMDEPETLREYGCSCHRTRSRCRRTRPGAERRPRMFPQNACRIQPGRPGCSYRLTGSWLRSTPGPHWLPLPRR